LAESEVVSTQPLLQRVNPLAQAHMPAAQRWPMGQA